MSEDNKFSNNQQNDRDVENEYVPIPEMPPVQFDFNGVPDTEPLRKKNGVSVSTLVISVICAAIAAFMLTYVLMNKPQRTETVISLPEKTGDAIDDATDTIKIIDDVIKRNFLYEVDAEKVYDYMIKGYMAGLGDKYAEYYNPEEYEAFISETNADMEGIGISVVYNPDYKVIQIIDVFPNSPAEEAGLCAGDYITEVIVDGSSQSVGELGYEVAISHLRGKAGTFAEFTLLKAPDYAEPEDYRIERKAVVEQSVTGRLYSTDKTVGVVRISGFNARTPEQFAKALSELRTQGAEKFIFDVRNNPGGELQSICTILDSLLPEGPVVRVIYNDGTEETVYQSDKTEETFPMVVLANENTASAGELFTCALRDYNKAKVVGVTTYGKGSIQTIAPLMDGGGIKYTYGYYCPPYSDNYDGKGITPDVEVEMNEEAAKKNIYTLTDSEDNQLTVAYEELMKNK